MLIYSVTTVLPMRVVTLLFPTDTLSASPPVVSPLIADGTLCGLALEDGRDIFRVDGHPISTRET